jgi:hypothetical protein
MDLLRRAFEEHPVAATVIGLLELTILLVIVSVLTGRVILPFGAIIVGLVLLVLWRRRKREAGPTLD